MSDRAKKMAALLEFRLTRGEFIELFDILDEDCDCESDSFYVAVADLARAQDGALDGCDRCAEEIMCGPPTAPAAPTQWGGWTTPPHTCGKDTILPAVTRGEDVILPAVTLPNPVDHDLFVASDAEARAITRLLLGRSQAGEEAMSECRCVQLDTSDALSRWHSSLAGWSGPGWFCCRCGALNGEQRVKCSKCRHRKCLANASAPEKKP